MTQLDPSLILYEALAADFGLVVATNNPQNLRAKLYAARRADADLEKLSIHLSPTNPSGELFIVKKGASNGQE